MKTFAFVVEVVVEEDALKTFIVRMPNGNVLGISQSVGSAAECIDRLTDSASAPASDAEK